MPSLTFWATLLVAVLLVAVLVLTSLYSDERRRRITAERRAIPRPVDDIRAFDSQGPTWGVGGAAVAGGRRRIVVPPPALPPPTKETPVLTPTTHRGRWLLVPLVVAIAATVAGCWPQPATLSTANCGAERPADIYLFGDSLAAMARTAACGNYADADRSVSYNALGGTQLDHWADAMAQVPGDATVIVELGTNDVTNDLMADMIDDLHGVLDSLSGAGCVVIPNLNTTGGALRGWPYSVRTVAFNTELARLVAEGVYPNLRVVDWAGESAGHPELLVGDTVTPADWAHYNAIGTPIYGDMLGRLPEVCG